MLTTVPSLPMLERSSGGAEVQLANHLGSLIVVTAAFVTGGAPGGFGRWGRFAGGVEGADSLWSNPRTVRRRGSVGFCLAALSACFSSDQCAELL